MIHVECIPSAADGGADGVEPAVLWFGARRVDIRAVTDRWFGSEKRWWKVETAEGAYILSFDETKAAWDLAAVVGR